MAAFQREDTGIKGVTIIHPFYMEDERGFFIKDYEKDAYQMLGIEGTLNEAFMTLSKKNVIRGMHFQIHNPQSKIVRCVTGTIQDVVIDLRRDSETFGEWESIVLSEDNHSSLYIPAGFAHGFKVLSDSALVSYRCIGKYDKETDTGIFWNDKEVGIEWMETGGEPIVSAKDQQLMSFREFCTNYGGI